MANKAKEEPKTAPQFDQWYNLTLGSSFTDDSPSNKYSTLRFIDEFKPASVDQSKPGTLHKNKDNRVSVEFQNSQIGKPKVVFEGKSEDYKDNEAVLFFDGEMFRLERIHRAVKSLRHVRLPGEAAASASMSAPGGPGIEPRLSPVAKQPKTVNLGSSKFHIVPPPSVPIEVERINVGNAETSGSGPKQSGRRDEEHSSDPPNASASPSPKDDEAEENQDIDIDDLFGTPDNGHAEDKSDIGIDINVPRQNDIDDEIADVDDSGDEAGKCPSAAEALKAQVDAEEDKHEQTSSSGSSSGSGSSGSGSGSGSSSSSSSDGEESDDVSVNSI